MVGIVVVSHSFGLAEGVAELARQMGGADVPIETAGGLDLPDHPMGTDAVMVMKAVERAWSPAGVLILMDLGSAVLSAEMAVDLLPEKHRANVLLCEAPLVEGAVAAAVTAKLGAELGAVAAEARGGLAGKLAHLGVEGLGEASGSVNIAEGSSIRLVVGNEHGLHARPAARLVQVASSYDARVSVRNLTAGRGPADAHSLNAVATLGVRKGHEIQVAASGRQAAQVLDAVTALAARRFDEAPPAVGDRAAAVPAVDAADGILRGFPVSPGAAVGPARHLRVAPMAVPRREAGSAEDEHAALERAIAAAAGDIGAQRETVARRAGDAEAAIFDAHLLFLRDDELLGPASAAIEGGVTAEDAWTAAIERLSAAWEGLDDEYLRARAADVRSVGLQVLAHLLGTPLAPPRPDAPGVLLAGDLSPAETAGLDPGVVLGIATAAGGPTSHTAVLARSLGIPAVVGMGAGLLSIEEGTSVAIDGASGEITLEPSEEFATQLRAKERRRRVDAEEARREAADPAVTADGVTVEVGANVGAPGEIAEALANGADGIGLFRTEFLFMGRDRMPDEAEQAAVYEEAAAALRGRPLLLRTLDVGADKPVPFLSQPPEDNPFLGVRGIRLSLATPALLDTQLRAILRTAARHPVRVMFPMVATVRELRDARTALDRARAQIAEAGHPPPRHDLEVGVMVEVPSAALTAAALAPFADFFSIGTNDLTQYALAADRGNGRVANLADALHPAVLRLIRETCEAAEAAKRWVGVCGELAGDAAATSLLLGLGVRELSMPSPAIGLVKRAVRATRLEDARTLAARALASDDAAAVRSMLAAGA
jgi:multiphosphoryl transfer protein